MPININIKRKIVVNGKEYGSVAEMPEDIRRAYEQALKSPAGAGPFRGVSGANTKIVFNGQEFRIPDEMPQGVRRLYESALAAAASQTAGGEIPRLTSAPASWTRDPKRVYRRIVLLYGGGGLLFALIVTLGTLLPAKGELVARLPWALVVPLALIGYAVYTSARYWRCPRCGAPLPRSSTAVQRRFCLRCGQPFEL